jgi:hypothetical protein
MSAISLNLSALFEQTFGYRTRAFEPQFKRVVGDGDNKSGRQEQGKGGSPYYATDSLGNEYFMPVTLVYADTDRNASQGSGRANEFSGRKRWELPYPVVSIESKKSIVETALTERSGTVKELVSIMDYEITIKGFIVATTHEFPEDAVASLQAIYELNEAISIQCPLTDIFLLRPDRSGSDQVVIKELKFPAVTGVKNIRPYELKLLSDEPFNLITT